MHIACVYEIVRVNKILIKKKKRRSDGFETVFVCVLGVNPSVRRDISEHGFGCRHDLSAGACYVGKGLRAR